MKKADLEKLIAAYTPFDATEAAFVAQLRDFLVANDDITAFDRSNPAGHITASSFTLNPDHSKALFVHHAVRGKWFQPGGHIDATDASLATACLRETTEESGIDGIRSLSAGIFDIDIHSIPENPKKNEPAHKHYDIRILLQAPHENFIASNESLALNWLTPDEVETLGDRDFVRMAAKWRNLRHG